MFRGQLLEHAPADVFFRKPAHPYSRALLSFASDKSALHTPVDKWQLDRRTTTDKHSPACVFARNCPEKMSVCEQREPSSRDIQHRNQHALGPHCVKCHLYDQ